MNARNVIVLLVAATLSFGCGGPTAPDPEDSEISRLQIFVRNWPSEYVEIDLKRNAGESTLVIFRPQQTGVPRILIDSIGPHKEDPEEVVQLMQQFDVWALADSNAVGGACSTKTGQWVCYPTVEDYSLAMAVTRGGTTRSQRYTRLNETNSSKTARALGDFIFAMSRKRAGGASRQ